MLNAPKSERVAEVRIAALHLDQSLSVKSSAAEAKMDSGMIVAEFRGISGLRSRMVVVSEMVDMIQGVVAGLERAINKNRMRNVMVDILRTKEIETHREMVATAEIEAVIRDIVITETVTNARKVTEGINTVMGDLINTRDLIVAASTVDTTSLMVKGVPMAGSSIKAIHLAAVTMLSNDAFSTLNFCTSGIFVTNDFLPSHPVNLIF